MQQSRRSWMSYLPPEGFGRIDKGGEAHATERGAGSSKESSRRCIKSHARQTERALSRPVLSHKVDRYTFMYSPCYQTA